jgi:hypothetical protein
MTTHTTGPLEVEVYGDTVIVSGGPSNDIATFHHIGNLAVSISKNEALANAGLFVAAGFLLAALEALLAILGGDRSTLPECVAARAAIARARGETP